MVVGRVGVGMRQVLRILLVLLVVLALDVLEEVPGWGASYL
jgi:hypothetical protein